MISSNQSTSSLRLARVTHVHPEGQSMNVIFLDNGDIGRDIQVSSPMAGTDFGFTSGIPSPDQEGQDENMHDDPDKRAINCVVASVGGMNVCLGFLYPQVTQMAFKKDDNKDRMIERHPSDFTRTVSQDADFDMKHPAGAYMRVGEGETPDDLEGKDFDGRYKIKRNKDKSVTITLWNADSKIQIKPNGDIIADSSANIYATAVGNIEAEAGGDIIAKAGGNIDAWAGGDINADAGHNITGRAGVDVILTAGVRIYEQAGALIHLKAPIIFLDGNVVFGGTVSGAMGGGGTVHIAANTIKLEGAMDFEGNIEHAGNMNTDGVHVDANGTHQSVF